MDVVFIALGFISELLGTVLKGLGVFVMGGVIFGAGYVYGGGEANFVHRFTPAGPPGNVAYPVLPPGNAVYTVPFPSKAELEAPKTR